MRGALLPLRESSSYIRNDDLPFGCDKLRRGETGPYIKRDELNSRWRSRTRARKFQ